METLLTIVFGIISVITLIVSYYFNIKHKIKEATVDAINLAEEIDAIGEEKMTIAIEQIYSLIPKIAKPFFSKEMIKQTIQIAFDKMEEYVIKQNK